MAADFHCLTQLLNFSTSHHVPPVSAKLQKSSESHTKRLLTVCVVCRCIDSRDGHLSIGAADTWSRAPCHFLGVYEFIQFTLQQSPAISLNGIIRTISFFLFFFLNSPPPLPTVIAYMQIWGDGEAVRAGVGMPPCFVNCRYPHACSQTECGPREFYTGGDCIFIGEIQ